MLGMTFMGLGVGYLLLGNYVGDAPVVRVAQGFVLLLVGGALLGLTT